MPAEEISRRHAFRLLAGAAIAAVPLFRLSTAASAARGWCRADPVLRIAGQTVHVYISSPDAMLRSATDKIRLVVTVPVGVEVKRLAVLADFGMGYDIRFHTLSALKVVNGRVPALVTVYCPARDATLPVNVDYRTSWHWTIGGSQRIRESRRHYYLIRKLDCSLVPVAT